jgi:hypothetical protein
MSEWSDSGKWFSSRRVATAPASAGSARRAACTQGENAPRASRASNSPLREAVRRARERDGVVEALPDRGLQ